MAQAGPLDAADVPGLWRARNFAAEAARRPAAGVSSGFAALDAALFDRGWPRAGLTELLSDAWGIGELRLLAPALVALAAAENRWIAWVGPPFVPYAPALEAAGVELAKVLLIRPEGQHEALWALEQALKSGACSAALGWLPEASLRFSTLRRLSMAARRGETWATLFRPTSAARNPSGAELRLRLAPRPGNRLRVTIVKRRGGWPGGAIDLALETN